MKIFLLSGAIFNLFGVALGAFAAHALKNNFSDYQNGIFQTAVHYQFVHATALLFLGLYARHYTASVVQWSGWLFLFGIIVFSGSLYVLAITQIKWLGAITPIGGVAFLLGWLFLAIGIFKEVSLG